MAGHGATAGQGTICRPVFLIAAFTRQRQGIINQREDAEKTSATGLPESLRCVLYKRRRHRAFGHYVQ